MAGPCGFMRLEGGMPGLCTENIGKMFFVFFPLSYFYSYSYGHLFSYFINHFTALKSGAYRYLCNCIEVLLMTHRIQWLLLYFNLQV